MGSVFKKSNLYLSIKAATNQKKPFHLFSTLTSQLRHQHQAKPVVAEQLSLVLQYSLISQNY